MNASRISVSRADAAALPFIMATERSEGFEHLVGRWEEPQHRAALADGRYAYFIGHDESGPSGFAIVRDWASKDRVSLIKRIAVARPGGGYGRALLAGVVNRMFDETDVWRIWLGVFPDNARARRAYQAVGFAAEGIARGNAYFGGVIKMSL